MKIIYLAVIAAAVSIFSYFNYQSEAPTNTDQVKLASSEDVVVSGSAVDSDEQQPTTAANVSDTASATNTVSDNDSADDSADSSEDRDSTDGNSKDGESANEESGQQVTQTVSDEPSDGVTGDDSSNSVASELSDATNGASDDESSSFDQQEHTAMLAALEERSRQAESKAKAAEEKLKAVEEKYTALLSKEVSAGSEVENIIDGLLSVVNTEENKISEMETKEKVALFQRTFEELQDQFDVLSQQYESAIRENENLIQKHIGELKAQSESQQNYALSVEQSQQERDQLERDLEQIRSEMSSEIDEKEGIIKQLESATKMLQLDTDVAFRLGSVSPSEQGREILLKVKKIIQNYPTYQISLEGHTDNVRIRADRRDKYPSNWELSAGRASAAARFLVAQGISPERLRVVGLGSYRPVDTNSTEEGRAKNRRLEILFTPLSISRERIQ
ncbi:MAG: OmpA family protein [Gammaproteobacteria bacterium]|nr:OmpA family protein [Gammaproteobacteria bacterium]